MSEAWMQMEAFNRERPLLTSIVIFALIVALLFGWTYIKGFVAPWLAKLTALLAWLKPATPPTSTLGASTRDAALQTLFIGAMSADAPDDALDAIVAVAKGYKIKAASKVAP